MTIRTITDIVPNGAAVPLSADKNAQATFVVLKASAAGVRVGDANVGSGRGIVLPDDDVFEFYPVNFDQGRYQLSQIFVWCAAGATAVSVILGD